MKIDLLSQVAATFLTLSLMSVGGVVAIVPELHHQAVESLGWLDDATFAHLFAIAQVAPGPNMLVVSLIGLHVAGWQGLIVSTVAFLLPAGLLAGFASTLIHRFEGTAPLAAIKAGLAPVALGLFAAGGVVLSRVADTDWGGVALSVFGAVCALTIDRNPLWSLGAGAVIGALMGWS